MGITIARNTYFLGKVPFLDIPPVVEKDKTVYTEGKQKLS